MSKRIIILSSTLSRNIFTPIRVQGLQGPQGQQGPQGSPSVIDGLFGAEGSLGSEGRQGSEGPLGDPGVIGRTGSIGVNGPLGVQGPLGFQGDLFPPVVNTMEVFALPSTINQNEVIVIPFNLEGSLVSQNGSLNTIEGNSIVIGQPGVYFIASSVFIEGVTSTNGFIIVLGLFKGSQQVTQQTTLVSNSVAGDVVSGTAILNISTTERLEIDDRIFVTVFNSTASTVTFNIDSRFLLTYIHN